MGEPSRVPADQADSHAPQAKEAHRLRVLVFVMSDKETLAELERFEPRAGGLDVSGVFDKQGMADTKHKPGDPLYWYGQDPRFHMAP